MFKKLVCAAVLGLAALAAGQVSAAPLGASAAAARPGPSVAPAQYNVQVVPQRNFRAPPPPVYYAPRYKRVPPAYGYRYYGPPRRVYRAAPAYRYAPPPRRVVRPDRYYYNY